MRVLALDAALARATAAVVTGEGAVLAVRMAEGARGQAAALPPMAEAVLAEAGIGASALDLVAVTVGPGSFTGLRAALALAHGIGLGAGVPVVGVGVAEAFAAGFPGDARRSLWVAIDSRRGRVFLDRGEGPHPVSLDELPLPDRKVALAGDAAEEVAARLAARGADALATGARLPEPAHVAAVGLARHRGALPPLPARPLYVDPPAVRPPPGGLRPPPGMPAA